MADEAKNEQAPKDLIGFLDFWLVKKAPFQLPEAAKEWIVKFGPWIDLVLLVISLPILFAAFSITTALTPFAMVGGPAFTGWYWITMAILGVQLVLQVFALPGLFARKMGGWTLLFYSEIVGLVYGLVTANIIGALISALIGMYFLFQIRTKYAK